MREFFFFYGIGGWILYDWVLGLCCVDEDVGEWAWLWNKYKDADPPFS